VPKKTVETLTVAEAKEEFELRKLAAETLKAELETRKLRSEVEYLDTNNEARRVLNLGTVDDHSARYLAENVRRYMAVGDVKEVTLEINSPGGYVLAGFALYDSLLEARAAGLKITTKCYGYAASMAGVMMQAGTKRIMTPNSWFMVHEMSAGAIGKFSELQDEVDLVSRMMDQGLAILADRSTLSQKQIKNRASRRDWWMSAAEAVKYGFADSIA
jgi:ATP-dependent Clp protease protease subunit